jgi:hypothetical protein
MSVTAEVLTHLPLADPGRPPHPGGRPCGALCVPACTAPPVTAGRTAAAARGAAVNDNTYRELINVRHAELRLAADQHRLVAAARPGRRRRVAHLLDLVVRPPVARPRVAEP